MKTSNMNLTNNALLTHVTQPTPNLLVTKSCADPGYFSGGGGSMPDDQKWTTYFFCPQLILQFIEGVQWFDYRENYTFPRIQRGSNIFRGGGGGGGGPTFSRGWGGGPNHNIERNPYNL